MEPTDHVGRVEVGPDRDVLRNLTPRIVIAGRVVPAESGVDVYGQWMAWCGPEVVQDRCGEDSRHSDCVVCRRVVCVGDRS